MKDGPSSRMPRVNSLIHQTLAELLRRRFAAQTLAVTLTGVETSPDLWDAKVLYSVLTDDKAPAVAFFRKNKGELGKLLSSEIRLKRIPRLHFVYDSSLKEAARLDQLLSEVLPTPLPKVVAAAKKSPAPKRKAGK